MRELVEVSGRICDAGREQADRSGKKGGLHSAIAQEIETEVERLIGDGALNDIDFQMIEIEARCGVADHGAGRRWEASGGARC